MTWRKWFPFQFHVMRLNIQREGSALFKVPSFIIDKKNLLVIHSIAE